MQSSDNGRPFVQRLRDWYDALAARFFYYKMAAIVSDESSAIHAQAVASQRRAIEQALEATRWAKQTASTDPDEQAILAVFQEGVLGSTKAMQQMLGTGLPTDPGRRAEALDAPFVRSGPSMPSSGTGSAALPTPTPGALPGPTSGSDPAPVRRPRGRPRKHPLPPPAPTPAPTPEIPETGSEP